MSSVFLDALTLLVASTHVLLAPYTKVEESFSLHATHDILTYGVLPTALPHFDHYVFPGAVPRTFIGSLLLAWLSDSSIWIGKALGLITSKFDVQIVVRLILATLNAVGLCRVRRAVSQRWGGLAGQLFTYLTLSQFHLPFWMGRTLPNMFALFPVNLSTYFILMNRPRASIALLTITGVIFRAELALYLAPVALQSLLSRSIPFTRLITTGISFAAYALILTIAADTYFWLWLTPTPTLLWPEFAGIYFNVVLGQSAEWGVDPWGTYFARHIPKMTMFASIWSGIGMLVDYKIRTLMLPALAFVGLISFLGHKEWRFIVYVVPMFNVAAAVGCSRIIRQQTWFGRFFKLFVTMGILLQCLVTCGQTMASMANYPGGEALRIFNGLDLPGPINVHISNLAAQTGASLFLHEHEGGKGNGWRYDKTENLTTDELFGPASEYGFTHLIAEVGEWVRVEAIGDAMEREWKVLERVETFDGWNFSGVRDPKRWMDPSNVVRMSKRTALVILERK